MVDTEHSVIAIEPEEIEADGEQSTTLTVTTRDEDGDILSGARVEIEALNGSSTISDRNQVTDEEGVASFTVTNGRPEIVTVKLATPSSSVTWFLSEMVDDPFKASISTLAPDRISPSSSRVVTVKVVDCSPSASISSGSMAMTECSGSTVTNRISAS